MLVGDEDLWWGFIELIDLLCFFEGGLVFDDVVEICRIKVRVDVE